MVDLTNGVAGLVPKVSSASIIKWTLIVIIIILVCAIIGYFLWYYFKKKKYKQYKVIIWEKDSTGNTHEHYDNAGVFLDKKTGFKLLFLERNKIGMNPNNIPYVTSKDRKGRLVKTVYLRKIGISNYVYCHVKMVEDGMKFTVGEEDANWLEQEMEKIRRTFGKDSIWSKLAPYIMFIITVLVVLIMMISLFNKFSILKETSANLLSVAELNQQSTELLYNMSQNPNLNSNVPIIVGGGIGNG